MFLIATSLAADRITARDRLLMKYARYNASAKGRERVDRYRSTAKGIFARERAYMNTRGVNSAAKLEMLTAMCHELGMDASEWLT